MNFEGIRKSFFFCLPFRCSLSCHPRTFLFLASLWPLFFFFLSDTNLFFSWRISSSDAHALTHTHTHTHGRGRKEHTLFYSSIHFREGWSFEQLYIVPLPLALLFVTLLSSLPPPLDFPTAAFGEGSPIALPSAVWEAAPSLFRHWRYRTEIGGDVSNRPRAMRCRWRQSQEERQKETMKHFWKDQGKRLIYEVCYERRQRTGLRYPVHVKGKVVPVL